MSNAKAGNGMDLGEAQGHAHARTPEDMRAIGRELGQQLAAGTVVILTGPLGAGKTTITQGIADGLAVKGRVQSPTFTIVRTHKPGARGIRLLHMDAYRLLGEGVAESIAPGEQLSRDDVLDTLESLDIDADLDDAVLVAEWGRGVVEELADRVLDVEITRAVGAEVSDGSDAAAVDVLGDGGLADSGEVIDMTDGDEDDPREVHWRWSE
ncbi:tRNA (adenosine(37)-N6)-threonylcarbamoyltransferase complex ATPase subunit type 1 TsaE [Corynebacterium urealyticum]|uniref:tRNA threonylcarbamoyladenosine biosynthesis protein TsaE n=1 Tax=Corynebacterium urealyticum (strain ATCC 43042 / DSM 7109) TaxID=504474 RepID=B1VF12_CORU7|nr:tRNA (adenosine(37)-N6)-threonylcarbamoyltransferase complex ATPase subunit type 1 TsaE [Corynebacterium urealyticum]QQC42134.1 tRNA (adenosine(37)-N6)-threonylcarbamoyltransferase complex ATPase subunit type 1 TsaE [Corynebacterium urealyticum]QQE50759.1 tRNA (adenosine(37)-N6)-threonylcarbamoyltransferase complex ATPase subunit type 1 TsaE [Corynebacterium urealyticum]TYR17788.1 tRNA (adenosine(37)-N6)-threonylcarbamoyltransferase complex ATPase subunit type 1 TsaE [Corynebacterium urealyti